jgi:FlaA1/EpsC-like NDP-sugar epimerase
VSEQPFRTWARPLRQAAADAGVWVIAVPLTTLLRYDLDTAQIDWSGVAVGTAFAVLGQLAIGYSFGLYRRRFKYASFDELIALASTVLVVGSTLSVLVWLPNAAQLPRSVPILATGLAITGGVALRGLRRMWRIRNSRPERATPIVVVGAGDAAHDIVRSLLAFPDGPYRPVAMVDDDPLKAKLRTQGVRVEGVIDELGAVARRTGAVAVLFAIPSAGGSLVRRVNDLALAAQLPLFVLPPVRDMFATPMASDIRPVTEEDLLGRETADIDPEAVAHYITGKRVMVTGAGGSIGSELCRQLARFEPAALIMLDRDESGLHAVQLSIEGRAMLDTPNLVLADIRDTDRLREVFELHRPHVVFHAAALKHLTLLEQAPAEAWKSNVCGSQNVLEAARAVGTERFVNISTDKAADPTNVLGYSKRLTERLTADMARQASGEGSYVSVRFGNVLGSRGSVLTSFRAQAEGGGPITVTDPDVTRYFMTVQEAVRLTVYAGAIGASGQVMVLDMGQPVRILDVAKRFAAQQEPPLEIVFTGLRAGEKLHEDLIGEHETDQRPVHPLISHVDAAPIAFHVVRHAVPGPDDATAEVLRALAYQPTSPDGVPFTADRY